MESGVGAEGLGCMNESWNPEIRASGSLSNPPVDLRPRTVVLTTMFRCKERMESRETPAFD